MAHCGYEATAVEDMLKNPLKGLRLALSGIKTDGAMVETAAPILKPASTLAGIPINVEHTK
jgi:hypothetical protein